MLTACTSVPAQNGAEAPVIDGAISLDDAIIDAAANIEASLEADTSIVVLSFESPSGNFSNYVLEELSNVLVNGRMLKVVDRANLASVFAELEFNESGSVSDSTAQQAGRMVGAQTIVLGSVTVLGDIARLRFKTIETEAAQIMASSSANIANDGIAQTLLAQGGGSSSSGSTVTAAKSATTAQETPAEVTYKIGDTGPSGGLIFYDKGTKSGGWRYLEAAPTDIEGQLAWSTESFIISDTTEQVVGRGKPNTEAIMKQASNRGGGFGWAAQACDAYSFNEFDDWFLPSRDELHWMFGNLHMQELGNFKAQWYWSSTTVSGSNASYRENFTDGSQGYTVPNSKYNVRPVRQF